MLIAQHEFQVKTSLAQLQQQYADIEGVADLAGQQLLQERQADFDPDRHDPIDELDAAREETNATYQLMEKKRESDRLNIVATMYQDWEKQLRDWIVKEMSHWAERDAQRHLVWDVPLFKLFGMFRDLGWDIRHKLYFGDLEACRLIVNVHKHGDGKSYRQLKTQRPELFSNALGELIGHQPSWARGSHADLRVTDAQVIRLSEAITTFWLDVPEQLANQEGFQLPDFS